MPGGDTQENYSGQVTCTWHQEHHEHQKEAYAEVAGWSSLEGALLSVLFCFVFIGHRALLFREFCVLLICCS